MVDIEINELRKIDAYWRAAHYLAVGQITNPSRSFSHGLDYRFLTAWCFIALFG